MLRHWPPEAMVGQQYLLLEGWIMGKGSYLNVELLIMIPDIAFVLAKSRKSARMVYNLTNDLCCCRREISEHPIDGKLGIGNKLQTYNILFRGKGDNSNPNGSTVFRIPS
ncbi:hypothetical protein HS088_TW09G00104 [Tripterygium wilfordii]|uniref:Uncharacterized protein n=1 Tax=Tripterygium wilfordii TaxID=458696 RepID=A0A7J7D6R7_TRIWF|nr:hypothetical protein HS088_TW09G00104 [Tripterygium wilfordii]